MEQLRSSSNVKKIKPVGTHSHAQIKAIEDCRDCAGLARTLKIECDREVYTNNSGRITLKYTCS